MEKQRLTRSAVPVSLLLAGAALLRLWNLDYGLPFLYRADESTMLHVASRIASGGNPRFIVYPHLVFYVLFLCIGAVAAWLFASGRISSIAELKAWYVEHPGPFYLVARLAAVAASLLSLFFVWSISASAFGEGVGLGALLLAAVNLIHFEASRIVKADVFMWVPACVSGWYSLRALEGGRMRDFVLAGVFCGLAASCLYNGALVFVAVAAAACLSAKARGKDEGGVRAAFSPVVARLAAAACASVLAFSLTSPFLVADPAFISRFCASLGRMYGERRVPAVGGAATEPEGLAKLVSRGAWGAGGALPFWCIVGAGLACPFLAENDERRKALVLVLPFAVGMAVFSRFRYYAMFRYVFHCYLLFLPAAVRGLFLAAGRASALLVPAERRDAGAPGVAVALVLVLLAVPALAGCVAQAALEGREDTRTLARRWCLEHIPAGARILMENNVPPIKSWKKGGVPSLDRYDTVLLPNYYESLYGGEDWVARTERETPTIEEIRARGIEYVILNVANEKKYRKAQGVFRRRLSYYSAVRRRFRLLYSVRPEGRPGPPIEIYRVTPSPAAVPTTGTW